MCIRKAQSAKRCALCAARKAEDSRQKAAGRKKRSEVGSKRSGDKDSPVEAAFPDLSLSKVSRDLTVSTNFLIF